MRRPEQSTYRSSRLTVTRTNGQTSRELHAVRSLLAPARVPTLLYERAGAAREHVGIGSAIVGELWGSHSNRVSLPASNPHRCGCLVGEQQRCGDSRSRCLSPSSALRRLLMEMRGGGSRPCVDRGLLHPLTRNG